MVLFCRLVEYDGCSCRQCCVRICLGMILTKLPILQAESQSKSTVSNFHSCKDVYCCLLGYDTAYLATLGPMEYFIFSQQCCSRLCYSVLNGKLLLTFKRSYSMCLHSQAVQFNERQFDPENESLWPFKVFLSIQLLTWYHIPEHVNPQVRTGVVEQCTTSIFRVDVHLSYDCVWITIYAWKCKFGIEKCLKINPPKNDT